jgi:hypothetical protein
MAGKATFNFAARPCDPKPIGAKGAALMYRNAASTEARLKPLACAKRFDIGANHSIEGDELCVPLK